MADDRLQGRAAVITGAGDGIGLGIAKRYARAGARLILAEFDDAKGEAAAEAIRAEGGEALFVHCDVTDQGQMEAAVQASVDRFGSVDILVNNAYRGSSIRRVEGKTDDEYRYAFAINFFGPKWAMVKALPHMRANKWGRIINICSLNGVNAHMGSAEYNTSKEALRTLTRSAAREWAPWGICANVICPAAVSAAYKRFSELQPEVAAATAGVNPMGRMGDPETDIAGVAVFLASEDARYLTGNTLFVDGGGHINGVPWTPDLPEADNQG